MSKSKMSEGRMRKLSNKLAREYPYSSKNILHMVSVYQLETVNEANVRRILEANIAFNKVKVTGGVFK